MKTKVRYLFVGSLNYLIANLIFSITWLVFKSQLDFIFISWIAGILNILVSYQMQRKFTFKAPFNISIFVKVLGLNLCFATFSGALIPFISNFTNLYILYVTYIFVALISILNWLIQKSTQSKA